MHDIIVSETPQNLVQWAINLYSKIVEGAVPLALVFGIGNLIVSTFLRVAFGGRLEFRGR